MENIGEKLVDHKKLFKYWILEILRIFCFVAFGLSIYSYAYKLAHYADGKHLIYEVLFGFGIVITLLMIIFCIKFSNAELKNYTTSKYLDKFSKLAVFTFSAGIATTGAGLIPSFILDFNNTKRHHVIGICCVLCIFLFLGFITRRSEVYKYEKYFGFLGIPFETNAYEDEPHIHIDLDTFVDIKGRTVKKSESLVLDNIREQNPVLRISNN
jgi:hypothetical protein